MSCTRMPSPARGGPRSAASAFEEAWCERTEADAEAPAGDGAADGTGEGGAGDAPPGGEPPAFPAYLAIGALVVLALGIGLFTRYDL